MAWEIPWSLLPKLVEGAWRLVRPASDFALVVNANLEGDPQDRWLPCTLSLINKELFVVEVLSVRVRKPRGFEVTDTKSQFAPAPRDAIATDKLLVRWGVNPGGNAINAARRTVFFRRKKAPWLFAKKKRPLELELMVEKHDNRRKTVAVQARTRAAEWP